MIVPPETGYVDGNLCLPESQGDALSLYVKHSSVDQQQHEVMLVQSASIQLHSHLDR